MFGKKEKTLIDYVPDHEPYNDIYDFKKPKIPDDLNSVEHKELLKDIDEFWTVLHPLVADFINSYGLLFEKMLKDYQSAKDGVESARRQLTFEQQNVQDYADQVRDIKAQLQNEIVVRRDLETRLEDEREMLTSQFNTEKKSLEVLANAQLEPGMSLDDIVKSLQTNIGDSEKVQRLEKKITDLEAQIKKEREENETIQGELSMSFMNKITKYDEQIRTLKERLGEE